MLVKYSRDKLLFRKCGYKVMREIISYYYNYNK